MCADWSSSGGWQRVLEEGYGQADFVQGGQSLKALTQEIELFLDYFTDIYSMEWLDYSSRYFFLTNTPIQNT